MGYPPVHIISHFNLITFDMIVRVTRHMLPHQVNRPFFFVFVFVMHDDLCNKQRLLEVVKTMETLVHANTCARQMSIITCTANAARDVGAVIRKLDVKIFKVKRQWS